MRQRRPADPTDPGDAADLSIMGYNMNTDGVCFLDRQLSLFLGAQSPNLIEKSTVS